MTAVISQLPDANAMASSAAPCVEEVGDENDGPHVPLDLDATSAQLETMSAELDALLKQLEEGGEVPAEVMERFNEDELEREGLEAAATANDPAESYANLEKRVSEVTSAARDPRPLGSRPPLRRRADGSLV